MFAFDESFEGWHETGTQMMILTISRKELEHVGPAETPLGDASAFHAVAGLRDPRVTRFPGPGNTSDLAGQQLGVGHQLGVGQRLGVGAPAPTS